MKLTTNLISLKTLSAAMCSLLLAVPSVFAADDEGEAKEGYFDEVIVTADKVEESVADIPMTITAFGSEMIEKYGIQDRDKLQLMVPGLQFGETHDQNGNSTSIRGISTRNAGINQGDRAVSTYVDGAYTVGVYGVAPGGGWDLERIEVARGPQGTLHGRNSMAGSLNYIYKKPTQDWELDMMTQANDYSQQRLNVAFGGPLTENLAFRLTGGVHSGDGYQENIGDGEDMNAPDEKHWAMQLRFQNDRIDTNIRYSRVTDNGIPQGQILMTNVNTTDPTIARFGGYNQGNPPPYELSTATNLDYLAAVQSPAGAADCPVGMPFQRCGDIQNKVNMNRSGFEDSEAEMLNFYVKYNFNDDVSLKYTYSDNEVHQYVLRDGDYTNRQGGSELAFSSDGGVPYSDRQYDLPYDYVEESHELLLTWDVSDKMNVIVGAFSYESEVDFELTRWEYGHSFRFTDPDEAGRQWGIDNGYANVTDCQSYVDNFLGGVYGLAVSPPADGGLSWYWCPGDQGHPGRQDGDLRAIVPFFTSSVNESEAVFANVDYKLNEKWSISAGLRWHEDKKGKPENGQGGSYMFPFGGVPVVTGYSEDGTKSPEVFDTVVGQVTLEYRTDNDNLLYGRVSTGHKPGEFNFASPPVPGIPSVVEESTLTNYEAGIKGMYLDGRLQLAVGAFFMDYDKMHMAATQPLTGAGQNGIVVRADNPTPLFEYTSAIPGTDVYGLEVEYGYAFSDNTSIFGFYAYTDSEVGAHESVIIGDPNAQYALYDHLDLDTLQPTQSWYTLPADMTGNTLPAVAKHKAALSLVHDYDLSRAGSLSFVGTWAYNGAQSPTIANVDLYEIPSLSRFDASVTYRPSNDNWSAMLYVNNVFDEIGLNSFVAAENFGGDSAPPMLGSATNHREFGVVLRWTPEF
jgi:outer membrane receptor protein involved in Fe transport